MNRKLHNKITSLDPHLRIAGQSILYDPPAEHILSGFHIDKGKSLLYFGFAFLPLCDRLPFLSLGYGDRFRDEYWGMEIGDSDSSIAYKFLNSVNAHRKTVNQLGKLENGIEYLKSHEAIDNVHVRRGLGCLLIVAERFIEAEFHLQEAMKEATDGIRKPVWLEEYIEDLNIIINLLLEDPIVARQYLLDMEGKNKEAFGIL